MMIDYKTFNSPELISNFRQKGYWPGKTLNDSFEEAVRNFPDKKALIQDDRVVTYKEFKRATDRLAAGLRRIGIDRGMVVSVQLPNCIEFTYLQIALARIGAIIQPIHMPFRSYEVESQLRFCEASAVVISPEYSGFNYMEMIQEIRPKLSHLRSVLTVGGRISGNDFYSIEEMCETGSSDETSAKEEQIDADDTLLLNFTSGTEGNPKGFLHTHNTIVAHSGRTAKVLGFRDTDVFLSFSPMTHTFGHIITYFSVLSGGTIVFVPKYDPAESLRLIEKEKITYMQGTPAHLIGTLNHANYVADNLKSLRMCFTGGSQVPTKLVKQLRDEIGCHVVNAYGQGENLIHTMGSTLWDTDEKMFSTVGRTMIGTEIKLVDETREKEVPLGEVGEICFRGPSLFIGYFKNPELTAQTRNEEGWFFTGDAGYLDDQGYLHLSGRKKEMINRGGTKIYPLETENLLHFHPKIDRVAVVGMPDARLGERVCAYIVTKKGQALTQEEVADYLNQHKVSRYKIPERIELIPEMPLNPTGKINKLQLTKNIADKLIEEGKWQTE
ncbi:class I adenylate-forming enzyme family protein [Georgfuchsia toluolica]|nr:AMP-binding protein [Georgfuchsia toluolica]